MATRRGPDNTARVAIAGTVSGNSFANIFWVQLTSTSSISQSDLDAWLTSFANQYKTSFSARQGTAVAYKQATATCFTPGTSVLQSSQAMTGNGTVATGNLPDTSASKIISWLTSVYWRGGKPRTYLPGLSTAETTTNFSLTSAEVTALQTAASGFRTAINALTQGTISSTSLGFVSFTSGKVPRPAPLFFSFTGAKVHPRFGTQRRRLGKWTV